MPETIRGTILIVEDETELRFIIAAQLRAVGFEVLEVGDGAAAIKLATECKPDLIIMDVGMPGLDGISATRALKENPETAAIPVIMLTARSATQDVVRGLEAGAQEYLIKPFEFPELLARVQTVHRLAVTRQALDRMNSDLENQVEAKTHRLRLLYDFMRDLNSTVDRKEIVRLLLRCVEQTTSARRISLFLLDESGERLICAGATGQRIEDIQAIDIGTLEGVTGHVFRNGKTYCAKTFGEGVGQRSYSGSSFLSTPLISTSLKTHEGIIGVLNVTEKNNDLPFTNEEVDCICSIADAAAIALESARRRIQLQQSVKVLLRTVGRLAEFRDEETTRHIERVSMFARILGSELQRSSEYAPKITDEFLIDLAQAAPLHDIGKVGICDEILTKPGQLTAEEFNIMKTHTDIGRRVLSEALDPSYPIPLLKMCIDIAYSHHERWDGKGYPRRLRGESIPLAARIVAVVDAYDAITSHRCYKKARTHEEAVQVILSESGRHFDPVIVKSFDRCAAAFNEVRELYADPAGKAPATTPDAI